MAGELNHYATFIRTLPCAACGTPFGVVGHHALYGTTYSPDEPKPRKAIDGARKGGAQKSHDWFLIPLCLKDHIPGVHRKKRGIFLGMSPEAVDGWEAAQVERCHKLYDKEFPNGDPKAHRARVREAMRNPSPAVPETGRPAKPVKPRDAARESVLEQIAEWAGARRLKDHEHALISDLINDLRAQA